MTLIVKFFGWCSIQDLIHGMDDSVGAGDVRLDNLGRMAVEHGESDVLATLQINFINKFLCLPSPREGGNSFYETLEIVMYRVLTLTYLDLVDCLFEGL